MADKPKILFISHVFPFPATNGQRQRVYYMLRGASSFFHVSFLTYSPSPQEKKFENELNGVCDEVIWLKSKYQGTKISRAYYKFRAVVYSYLTGLKPSNYFIGKLDFTENNIAEAVGNRTYDVVMYEYFHAWESVNFFKNKNIPVILDTHNILWQSYLSQYKSNNILPGFLKGYYFKLYKNAEERIWSFFDEVIAINSSEQKYIRSKVPSSTNVPLICMGVDISSWPYSWQPANPIRLGYYGGLGSPGNEKSAIVCAKEIMPEIWKIFPEAELWLIGSNPREAVKNLESDKIHVTGFVKDVATVINKISVMLCPWEGTFGFRSRIVEVMALGVPVVASNEAVDGMGMENGKGIFLTGAYSEIAAQTIRLLKDKPALDEQSKLAREEIISKFSYESTYLEGFQKIFEKTEQKTKF